MAAIVASNMDVDIVVPFLPVRAVEVLKVLPTPSEISKNIQENFIHASDTV